MQASLVSIKNVLSDSGLSPVAARRFGGKPITTIPGEVMRVLGEVYVCSLAQHRGFSLGSKKWVVRPKLTGERKAPSVLDVEASSNEADGHALISKKRLHDSPKKSRSTVVILVRAPSHAAKTYHIVAEVIGVPVRSIGGFLVPFFVFLSPALIQRNPRMSPPYEYIV